MNDGVNRGHWACSLHRVGRDPPGFSSCAIISLKLRWKLWLSWKWLKNHPQNTWSVTSAAALCVSWRRALSWTPLHSVYVCHLYDTRLPPGSHLWTGDVSKYRGDKQEANLLFSHDVNRLLLQLQLASSTPHRVPKLYRIQVLPHSFTCFIVINVWLWKVWHVFQPQIVSDCFLCLY